MNQAKATTATNTHSVSDLEGLRLQLEEAGYDYCNNRDSNEHHEQLLHTLQTNDCREIIAMVVDEDDLANVFVVAANRNHVDILEEFLNHGMNIDIKNERGWTALMYASCNGQEQCVRFLLEHNTKVSFQDKNGYTALVLASQRGNSNIVEMLLEKNANSDIQDKGGMTALVRASVKGHKEVVQILLTHGVDIECKDNNGKTALDLANGEEIKELIQNHVTTSYVLK